MRIPSLAAIRAAAIVVLLLPFAPAVGAITIDRVVSPRGIEAWLVQDRTVPVIALEFAFHGGSALDPAGKEGLSEIVAALLDEGAGDLDSQAFARRLEDNSISLGFSAATDSFGGSLRTLTRNRAIAFDSLKLALTAPRFDEAAVEKIKSQKRAWLAGAAENPRYLAGRAFSRAAFPDHPYGRPAAGTRQSVERISKTDIEGFAAQRFARDRLVIGVVGDITPEALAPRLDELFGHLPAAVGPIPLAATEPALKGQVFVIDKKIPQSVVTFGQRGLARDHPDYYTAFVINQAFGGGGLTSRLTEKVREERGLAYGIGTSLSPMDYAALWMGGVATANERVSETLQIVREQWRRLRDDGLTEAELADAKTFLTGSFLANVDSTGRMAGLLVGVQLEDLGIDYLDKRNGFIEAVTMDDVRRVARSLVDPDSLTFAVVGQPQGVEATAPVPPEEG